MDDTLERLLRESATKPGLLGLAGGLPSDAQFPRQKLAASFLRTVQQGATLQYGWPEGHLPLRQQIAARLNARGAQVVPEDVLVTSGAQQAIAIAAQLACKPGDRMGVDPLSYSSALDLFRTLKLVATPWPATDDDVRVWYVMPVVGNPGGYAMSADRRTSLLARRKALFLEDDAYADLRFGGPAGRPLLADAPDRTFHIGTFSKVLCPGLRVGWLVAPKRFRKRARALKGASDLQAGTLAQSLLSDYLAHDDLDKRLVRLRRFYEERARALLVELETTAPCWRAGRPSGGFSVWVDTDTSASEVGFLSLAIEEGVSFDPGSSFRADASPTPLSFRLCFSTTDPRLFSEAVKRLARAWRRMRQSKASPP